ncbi:hypothetical protein AAMO2058_000416800 [Amorphochlora amoebiformis]
MTNNRSFVKSNLHTRHWAITLLSLVLCSCLFIFETRRNAKPSRIQGHAPISHPLHGDSNSLRSLGRIRAGMGNVMGEDEKKFASLKNVIPQAGYRGVDSDSPNLNDPSTTQDDKPDRVQEGQPYDGTVADVDEHDGEKAIRGDGGPNEEWIREWEPKDKTAFREWEEDAQPEILSRGEVPPLGMQEELERYYEKAEGSDELAAIRSRKKEMSELEAVLDPARASKQEIPNFDLATEEEEDTDLQWLRRVNLTDAIEIGNFTGRNYFGYGNLSTLAGHTTQWDYADGEGSNAKFEFPGAIARHPVTGEIFVSDLHTGRIRKLIVKKENGTMTAQVTTVTGFQKPTKRGGYLRDGAASEAQFNLPSAMAFHPKTLDLLITDTNNHRIRALSPDGTTRVFAGTADHFISDGTATASEFRFPQGIAIGPSGTVYVAQTPHDVIRQITPDMEVSTYCGICGSRGTRDGARLNATFAKPRSLAVDGEENLYIMDFKYSLVRRVDRKTGLVTTIAGNFKTAPGGGIDGYPESSTFCWPEGIAVDPDGNVLVADSSSQRIRIIYKDDGDVYSVAGRVITWAGFGTPEGFDSSNADGRASNGFFHSPWNIAVGGHGDLFITDKHGNRIRYLDAYLPKGKFSKEKPRTYEDVLDEWLDSP